MTSRHDLPAEWLAVADQLALVIVDMPEDAREAALVDFCRGAADRIHTANEDKEWADCAAMACMVASRAFDRVQRLDIDSGGRIGRA